jgi:hypothetical protein
MAKSETTRDLIDPAAISLATKHVKDNRPTGICYIFLSTLMQTPEGKHVIVDDGKSFDINSDGRKWTPYSEVRQVSSEHAAEMLASGEWELTGGGVSAGG